MRLSTIQEVIDPLGPPTEIGPITVTVPNPFGGEDIPVTICAEGCPVPATAGDASLQTSVTVTIWVDDEIHSETVPVEL